MSNPTEKPGEPHSLDPAFASDKGEPEAFEDFFGGAPPNPAEVADLMRSFEYASEDDRESRIFAEPLAAEDLTPQPATPAKTPSPSGPLPHLQARRLVNQAQSVGEVTDAFLAYTMSFSKRTALFVSRAPRLLGWDARGEGWNRDLIRGLEIPLDEPSIFRLFRASAGYYLGPIPKTPVNDQFVQLTGGKRPKSCLIAPVLVGHRVVNVLYADNGHASEIDGEFSDLLLFVLTVGQAYERLIRARAHTGGAGTTR